MHTPHPTPRTPAPSLEAAHSPTSSDTIIGRAKCPPTAQLGLYLHWPFCETKCGYCDFYSVPLGGENITGVARALCMELSLRCRQPGPRIATVFFGGGTPTTLDDPALAEVLATVRAVTPIDTVEEFTVEANPATVAPDKVRTLVAGSVNRVSLGAQSFHPTELAFLERLHDPADIPIAVRNLRAGGIANLNLDLIFGIPGQTSASWRESIQRTLDLEPDHVACYGLTYEPNTALTMRLRQGRFQPCDESLEADMYLQLIDTLADAGLEQYEISNFARPGRRCAHNLIYWRNQQYLAVGPSAAGHIGNERYKNIAHHGEYVRRIEAGRDPAAERETLSRTAQALETLLMGLRLIEGIDLSALAERTTIDLTQAAAERVRALSAQGLVVAQDGRLRLTRAGLLVADGVIAELATTIDERPGRPLPVVRTTH